MAEGVEKGRNLPQCDVDVARCLAHDDTCAQQHRADRVHPHRCLVHDQYTFDASICHDQLPDGHLEALDEERYELVHLWVP